MTIKSDFRFAILNRRRSSGLELGAIQVVTRKNRARKRLMMNVIKVNPSQSHYLDWMTAVSVKLIKSGQAQIGWSRPKKLVWIGLTGAWGRQKPSVAGTQFAVTEL